MTPTQLLGLFASVSTCVLAVDWHFVSFVTSSGQTFTSQSGKMIVPALPEAETNYLWPGLQDTDNTGVYQNVLDGSSGTWWFGSGWCCSNPSLAWGGGFNAYEGDIVTFNNTLANGTDWVSTITSDDDANSVTNSFALGDKEFTDAPFAAELYGSWDFGSLIFQDVVLVATGDQTSFCTDSPSNYNSATNVSVTGVSSVVGEDSVTCYIDQIALWGAL